MALSQVQCLDNHHVNWRISESKPEFLYSEEQRLALEALVTGGRDAHHEYLKQSQLRPFLSDPELERLWQRVEEYRPGAETRGGVTGDDGEVGGGEERALSLQYWPDRSDDSVPQLDIGWPDCAAYRGVTRATVYTQPPTDAQPHIKEVVRKTIAQAQKVIAVVMDVFTDVDIFRDLLEAGFRRRVAVYVVIDTGAVNQFLDMCTRASMHTGHLQFLRVRSTGGSEFYTRSAQLICGTLAQRFLLVDGDKAISGSYSFTWSASRLDRNLITVLSGQAVETFDRQFCDLWLTSRGVSLSSIPLDELPAPEPTPAPAPVLSATVARKMINPKYALVSADTASRTSSDKNSKDSAAATTNNALLRANRAQRGGAKLVHTHPGLLGLAKANLVAYLPIWPEPDPPSDVIGYINIRDVSRPAPAHLMRSQLAETSQAIRFSRPLPPAHTEAHTPADPQTHTHTDTHTKSQTHTDTHTEAQAHKDAQTHTETHTRNDTHTPRHTPAATDVQSGTHTDEQRKTQSHTHSSSLATEAKTNTHTHTHTPHTQQPPTPDTHTPPVNTHAQQSSTHTSDTQQTHITTNTNTQQTHITTDTNTKQTHTSDTDTPLTHTPKPNTPLSHPSTPPTPKPRTVKLRLNSDGTDIRTNTHTHANAPSHTPRGDAHKASHTPRARRQAKHTPAGHTQRKSTHTHKASAEQTHTASSEHTHSSSSEEYEDPIDNTHTHHEDDDDGIVKAQQGSNDIGVVVATRGQGSDASEEFYDCDSADATSCHDNDPTSGDANHDDGHTPSSPESQPPAVSPATQRLNLMARLSQSMLDLRPQPQTQCFKSSSRSPGREAHGRVGGAKVVIAKPGGYIGSGAIGRSPASRNPIGRSPACRPVIGGARYWQDRLSSSGHTSPTHTPQDANTHSHTRYGRPARRQTALFAHAHSSCSPTRRYGTHTHAHTHAHTHTQSPSPARHTHTGAYYRRAPRTHTLSCPPTARHTHTLSESPSPRTHTRSKAATATGSRGVTKTTNSGKKGSAGHKK